ncbi:TetR/AcrR family transcriptional regulator [Jiangella ureilytica]|uniref:TetR/AcrR family transcriptional regulator n=1 Tax=Jiangella ureilytica TaxID=2530374 RepID=UPI0013A5CBA3|nr:TetR/AcrR family transcriptional regulator [Jiangella ureilytica]
MVPSPARRRTRQTIIEAAIAVWARDRDATLSEIADRAETHRATLHRHFPSRTDLLVAAIRHSIGDIVTATEAAAVTQGTPQDALHRLMAAYLTIGDRIRFLFDDHAIANHPAVAELAAIDGPVIDLIRRGQADGTIDAAFPPAWIERSIWALVYAASEAVDDGTLAAHEALPILLRTVDDGIARHT